jgi:hypothetical protein
MLENFDDRYQSRGKYIFVPNEECDRRGETLLRFGAQIDLPSYFFHYRSGGHVAALHEHRSNRFFFRIDLKNFFYSISRNRLSHMLRQLGFHSAREYAAWSHSGGRRRAGRDAEFRRDVAAASGPRSRRREGL